TRSSTLKAVTLSKPERLKRSSAIRRNRKRAPSCRAFMKTSLLQASSPAQTKRKATHSKRTWARGTISDRKSETRHMSQHTRLTALTLLLLFLFPVSTLAQSALQRVRQSGELRIGTDATDPPFE